MIERAIQALYSTLGLRLFDSTTIVAERLVEMLAVILMQSPEEKLVC